MKINPALLALLASIVIGPAGVNSQTRLEAHGGAPAPKDINVVCPDNILVGPVSLPGGWESTGGFPMNFLSIDIKTVSTYSRQHMVVCWYGDGKHPLSINYKVPAGYSCKAAGQSSALCKVLWK